MKQQDIFLVAFYYAKPKPHVNTGQAGWMNNPDNIRYDERVEITRGVKNNANTAKVILNLSQKTVQKNGWGSDATFNELFKYYFAGYHQYITTVMTQLDPEYFGRMVEEMQSELDSETQAEQ